MGFGPTPPQRTRLFFVLRSNTNGRATNVSGSDGRTYCHDQILLEQFLSALIASGINACLF